MDFRLKILDLSIFQQLYLPQALDLLSTREKTKLQSFGSKKRQLQWLAVRFLTYEKFGIDEEIQYSPAGQPLLNCCQISISHTGQLVAVAISNSALGLDVEQINRNFRRIAVKYVNDSEQKATTTQHLALLWSAKEAVYKLWAERGLGFKQNIILNLPEQTGTSGLFDGQIIKNNRKIPVFVNYYAFKQHFITLARYEKT